VEHSGFEPLTPRKGKELKCLAEVFLLFLDSRRCEEAGANLRVSRNAEAGKSEMLADK